MKIMLDTHFYLNGELNISFLYNALNITANISPGEDCGWVPNFENCGPLFYELTVTDNEIEERKKRDKW